MESNCFDKMRSGILEIRKALHKMYIGEIPLKKRTISAVIGRCDGMLEIPPRNCDVGTADEITNRFVREWEYAFQVLIDKRSKHILSQFSRWSHNQCKEGK